MALGMALKWGVFHSVSAFCNAGFDILGVLKPGSSLMLFQKDPVVCLTIMALIVVGGWVFLFGRICSGRCVPVAYAACRCIPGWS